MRHPARCGSDLAARRLSCGLRLYPTLLSTVIPVLVTGTHWPAGHEGAVCGTAALLALGSAPAENWIPVTSTGMTAVCFDGERHPPQPQAAGADRGCGLRLSWCSGASPNTLRQRSGGTTVELWLRPDPTLPSTVIPVLVTGTHWPAGHEGAVCGTAVLLAPGCGLRLSCGLRPHPTLLSTVIPVLVTGTHWPAGHEGAACGTAALLALGSAPAENWIPVTSTGMTAVCFDGARRSPQPQAAGADRDCCLRLSCGLRPDPTLLSTVIPVLVTGTHWPAGHEGAACGTAVLLALGSAPAENWIPVTSTGMTAVCFDSARRPPQPQAAGADRAAVCG